MNYKYKKDFSKMKVVAVQILKFILLTVAGILYASAIALFLDPNNMAPGGVSGISVLINRVTGMETGTLIFLLNIPIMMLGAWKFGVRFIISTVYVLFVTSISTNIISDLDYVVTTDRILAAFSGGVMLGAGIGITFRLGATTGGVDIIVKILRQRYSHIKSGEIFLMLDGIVIVASAFLFKDVEVALYAAIAILVSSFTMDKVLYGTGAGKLVHIITDHHEVITQRILHELRIGVTCIEGVGAYSKNGKDVLMCVVRKSTFAKLKEIVAKEDPNAFMFISPATEVFGEGYKRYDSEEI